MRYSFFPGSHPFAGLLHRLDPRVKTVAFTLLAAAIVLTRFHQHLKFLLYLVLLVSLMVFSRIPLRPVARRLFPVLSLLLFISAAVLVFERRPLSENTDIILNVAVKTGLAVLCLSLLTLTTEFSSFIKGLELMNMPPLITSLLRFTYRYLILFLTETEMLKKAKESRSFGRAKIKEEIKALKSILCLVFSRTLERSQRVYAAMLSRGYDGRIQTMNFLTLKKIDFIFSFLFFAYLVIVYGVI